VHISRTDVLGLSIVVLLIGWANICAAAHPHADARNLNLLLIATTAAYIVARVTAPLVPVIVAIGALCLEAAAGLGHHALHNDPLAGPLGYENADAALALLATVAAGMAAASTSRRLVRGGAVVVAVAGAATAGFDGSKAAGIGAAVVIIATLGALWRPFPRGAILGGSIATALVLALTIGLGLAYASKPTHPNEMDRLVERTFTYNRPLLWHDAEQLTAHHPATGVGPERFQDTSPTALGDPLDLRWAHNAFLQQSAELGVPGGALTAALAAWCFLALARSRRTAAVVTVASIGLAALLAQALQDYVLHFAAVTVTAGALLGAATSRAPPDRSKTFSRHRS
jgi:O-antigen ligase